MVTAVSFRVVGIRTGHPQKGTCAGHREHVGRAWAMRHQQATEPGASPWVNSSTARSELSGGILA